MLDARAASHSEAASEEGCQRKGGAVRRVCLSVAPTPSWIPTPISAPGQAGGSMGAPRPFVRGTLGCAVAVGDFTGDCHADIAGVMGDIDVLLGDGRGGFTLAQSVPAGKGTDVPASGDFDDDGADDIAVPNANEYPRTVFVALSTQGGGGSVLRKVTGGERQESAAVLLALGRWVWSHRGGGRFWPSMLPLVLLRPGHRQRWGTEYR